MKRSIIGLFFVVILVSFSLVPFARPGFFSMHDDTQVGRVIAMGRALRLGQFPVRWVSDLGYGYGYPIYNFYGPLPYYAGGVLYALGMSGLTATKIMFVAGSIGAAFTMFLLASRLFGGTGGLVAAILYAYAPYHAVDVYIRGAVGEFWTLVFFPLIFLGILEGWKKSPSHGVMMAAVVGLFGVITSHTILGYVTVVGYVGLLGILTVFSRRNDNRRAVLKTLGVTLLLALGLSSFFWLPAITEMRFTDVAGQIGPTARYNNHFVCLGQLWDSPWGFAGSAHGCIDGISFRLGKFHLVLAALASVIWLLRRRNLSDGTNRVMMVTLGTTLISMVMMLPVSDLFWRFMPNFSFIQYPWRFLTFAIFGLSILAGSLVVWLPSKIMRIAAAVAVIAVTIGLYQKLFVPQKTVIVSDATYESDEYLRFNVSKISDEYLPPDLVAPKDASEIVRDTIEQPKKGSIRTIVDTDTYARFSFTNEEEEVVTINRAYFPGWQYLVNSVRVTPAVSGGLPRISVPKGEGTIEIKLDNTPVRWLGNILTIATFVFIILRYGKEKKTNA